MRKLDVSAVTTTNAMPVKSGVWEHLQLAYQEAIAELGKSLFGNQYDATKVYILNGIKNTGTGSNYIISAGSVFFNGEVFLVDVATFTISGPNVARGIITTTFYSGIQADGVEFTDGDTRNIHQIRKIVISAGLAGSGAGDFNNFIDLKYKPQGGIGQTIEWAIPYGTITDFFDATSGNGIHGLTLGWVIDDKGYFVVGYKAGDADFGTIGTNPGVREITIEADNLPPFDIDVPASDNGTANGSQQRAAWSDNEAVSPGDITASFTSPNNPIGTLPPHKVKLKITRYQ